MVIKDLKQEKFIVSGLIIVGFLMYLFLVPFKVFWIDESMVVNFTYQSNSQMISNLMNMGAHPPLYYLLIKAVRIIFGDVEFFLRLVSGIFFILTSVFVYLLAREIGGKRTGYLSLILWASNFFLLFYSKQVRPYSLLAFLSIAATYYFYKILNKYKLRDAIFYSIVVILGLYTNYWFVLIFLAHALTLVISKNKDRKLLWILGISGASFLPWGLIYIFKFKNYASGEFIGKPGLSEIWESLSFFGMWQWFIIIPAVIVGVIGFIARKNIDKNKAIFLFLNFVIPLASALIISQFVPIYTPGRREIVVAPVFIVIVAYIISRIENIKWQVGVSLLLILFTFQNMSLRNDLIAGGKSTDLTIIKNIIDKSKSDDRFILYGLTNANFNYYTRRLNKTNLRTIYFPEDMKGTPDSLAPILVIRSDPQKFEESLNKLSSELDDINNSKIFAFFSDDDVSPRVIEFLDMNFKRIEEIIPEEPHMATWISRVLIYEK